MSEAQGWDVKTGQGGAPLLDPCGSFGGFERVDDSIVPPAQTQQVAGAAANLVEKVSGESADHNDPVLLDGPKLIAAVKRLAEHLEG